MVKEKGRVPVQEAEKAATWEQLVRPVRGEETLHSPRRLLAGGRDRQGPSPGSSLISCITPPHMPTG